MTPPGLLLFAALLGAGSVWAAQTIRAHYYHEYLSRKRDEKFKRQSSRGT